MLLEFIHDDSLLNLIHDLRQPLSAIEIIAFHLESRLPEELTDARKFVVQLQQLVEDANVCMSEAVLANRKSLVPAA